jgi:hypothetical protein
MTNVKAQISNECQSSNDKTFGIFSYFLLRICSCLIYQAPQGPINGAATE